VAPALITDHHTQVPLSALFGSLRAVTVIAPGEKPVLIWFVSESLGLPGDGDCDGIGDADLTPMDNACRV
jgi:hypothetical protein